ncbi:MAG TPA: cell division protein FtsZ [Candidatus Hydrogenedentes bacterium]|nr:cell division protein FtsZ [Candidatus Hydrogenedentota bacterium]
MSDEFASFDQRAVIKVCGIGGGGGNAVARMVQAGLKDVDFIAINTDAQALKTSAAGTRLQIGANITQGLGSGARPEIGEKSALEDRERVTEVLRGADMVFLTAGLGGGTGTGASPIVAEVARASGALTVGIVTLPFQFEGKERMDNALKGLAALEEHVDTLIVVPNDRLATLCQKNISLLNAFEEADEVLHNGVRAITELITVPGLINLDFADVRTIMEARGRALMGIGVAEGEQRAARAAQDAIVCPLLEQSNIHGAMGVVVNIKGGCDIGMREIQDAVSAVKEAAHPDANIIFGAVVDEQERPELQVTVIAAGFSRGVSEEFLSGAGRAAAPRPAPKAEPPAAAAPARERTQEPVRAPEVQYLFPEEEALSQPSRAGGTSPPGQGAEPVEGEEDLDIPAFMRKRKKEE